MTERPAAAGELGAATAAATAPSPGPASRRQLLLGGVSAGLTAALAGCASTSPQPTPGWHSVQLPGKTATRYSSEVKAGRQAWAARSERSASMWRRRLAHPAERIAEVHFSWWVDRLIGGASVGDVDREDASARVLFGFGGDASKLSRRNRMMFELAHALTGEAPPYATLMYVWESHSPVESVVVNPRSDRVRSIVVDSGTSQLGQWRDHRRHLANDFRRAFGEAPGHLQSVALMTDTDNTRSTAQAWYGPVRLG